MKKFASILSLLLILSMLLGAFAACGVPEQQTSETESGSIEATTDNQDSESESESETESESDSQLPVEVTELDSDFGDSILYANEIMNGVQAGYTDGVKRDSHYVENLNMSAEFGLMVGEGMKVTHIKNKTGDSYLENTMDTYIRMKDGKTYYASDSLTYAKSNAYRIGYYYYDVHTLEQSFYSDYTVTDEIVYDLSAPSGYNGSSISTFESSKELIKYTVSGTDPYFYFNPDEFSAGEWDAILITVKATGSVSGQLFAITTANPIYSGDRSTSWNMVADGEFHTYLVSLSSLANLSGNITGLRFDIGSARETVEISEIKVVKLESKSPNVYFDRIWHTYSDKVHQDLHFTAPDGQKDIDAIGMITEISADTVDKIIVKDGNGNHETLDGVDWASAEYIGFDIKNVGIFGYIMPYDNKSGSIKVTLEDGNYIITQEYIPENNEIKSPKESGGAAENDVHFGHRLYTDANHTFDEFLKEADWERNPMKGINSSSNKIEYDALRGAYSFGIAGTDFSSAFFTAWNRHYSTSVTIKPRDKDRKIYVRTETSSGCLECAVLLDSRGLVIPIPLEVSKNFSDGEDPITNYGDITWGETVFPLVVSRGKECEFEVVNLYQNWGNFPLKQLSSIAYHAPYYHLSIGVTETSCISPWYVRGRTLWTLPDFRSVSAPYWFELEGSDYKSQPQHTHADTPTIIQYTDAEGNWYAAENIKNTVLSNGPIYTEVEMDYISDDSRIAVTYNHLEMPQTDELRAYYEVEFEILEDISFNDFKNDFSFYGFGAGNEYKLGYVNEKDKVIERPIAAFKDQKEFILGKNAPFFCLYDKRSSNGKPLYNSANIGFLIHSSDITIGGEKFDGNFIVINKRDVDKAFHLSLDLDEVTLKAGDRIAFNIIIIPWGSHLSKDASNMIAMRENTVLDPYTLTAINGEVVDSVYLPRFKSTNGKSAEFTISGGANNAAIRVYGFDKLTAPKIYEKIDGEWVPYQISSINNPDKTGRMHYYDGYMTYYDGDGTYSYAFAVNMDETESRTFKIEAIDRFTRWPKVEIVNNDPINFYYDPNELTTLFSTSPNLKVDVSGDATYARFEGVGSSAREVSGMVFNNGENIPTGKYVVVKYRSPSTNQAANSFQFYVSTKNASTTASDNVAASIVSDDAWHILVIDVSSYLTNTFVPAEDGQYYATHLRFDVFNAQIPEGDYLDIAYVGLCDSLEKLFEIEKESEGAKMIVEYYTKTEHYDPSTGEKTNSITKNIPVDESAVVSITTNVSQFVPSNAQGYNVSDVPYFGRIDTLCGYGPGGVIGKAYGGKGSNSKEGVAIFEYNMTVTPDYRMVFAGWSFIWGGVEKYVWSADEGKTWQDVELYKRDAIGAANSGMFKHPATVVGGGTEEEWGAFATDANYQGGMSGPLAASGLAADLTSYKGQKVNVIFAAVPKSDTTSLCILAYVKNIEVEHYAVEAEDGPLGKDIGVEGEGVTFEKDFSKFIDPSNAQGYTVSDLRYFGRIDSLNRRGGEALVEGTNFSFKGSSTANGVAVFTYNNQTTSDSKLLFAGWSLVKGGVEKYVWSADGGKTWHDIELTGGELGAAGDGMIRYANSTLGREDFYRWAANASYQGRSAVGAVLTDYVGQTVNVTFAAVPSDATDTLCILAHVTGVEVIDE